MSYCYARIPTWLETSARPMQGAILLAEVLEVRAARSGPQINTELRRKIDNGRVIELIGLAQLVYYYCLNKLA